MDVTILVLIVNWMFPCLSVWVKCRHANSTVLIIFLTGLVVGLVFLPHVLDRQWHLAICLHIFFFPSAHRKNLSFRVFVRGEDIDWKVWCSGQKALSQRLEYFVTSMCKLRRKSCIFFFPRTSVHSYICSESEVEFVLWLMERKMIANCVQKALGIFPPIV